MKTKKLLALILLVSISYSTVAQQNNFKTVYLIGDAGEYGAWFVLDKVREELEASNDPALVLFLGDNLYPKGLENTYTNPIVLDQQISLINTSETAASIFLPGNHDWQRGMKEGMNILANQERYIEFESGNDSKLKKRVNFLPKDGIIGPAFETINSNVELIIIDSQWYLQSKYKKFVSEDSINYEAFLTSLGSKLEKTGREHKKVVIAMHHPFYSIGPHGKNKLFLKLCWPILEIASLATLRTQTPYMLFSQDLPHRRYKKFKNDIIKKVMENYVEPYPEGEVFFVSGHDHNLQYWKSNDANQHFIISGSAAKKEYYFKGLAKKYEDDVFKKSLVFPAYSTIEHKSKVDGFRGYIKLDFNNQDNSNIIIEYYDDNKKKWLTSKY